MSETQATESHDETETKAVVENVEGQEAQSAETETDEVEIVVEGEAQPASEPDKQIGIRNRINKLNTKVEVANTATDEALRKLQVLEEENKLLKLQSSQSPAQMPDEDNFDSRKEYLAALNEYNNNQIAEQVQKQTAKVFENVQTQTATATQDDNLRGQITKHYDRANDAKIKGYEALEDKAIEILGNDLSKQIMANSSKSHLIMGHLGANTAKAREISELLKTNPIQAYTEALEVGLNLSTTRKKPSPSPETEVPAGGSASVGIWQKKYDDAIAKVQAGTLTVRDTAAIRKQAQEAGVTLR